MGGLAPGPEHLAGSSVVALAVAVVVIIEGDAVLFRKSGVLVIFGGRTMIGSTES
ncbi:MAG: hypothetical protein WCI22_09015 [Actinomycetota bacterium]